MAEIVDNSRVPGAGIGYRIDGYPWHEWSDGKARKLIAGVDYKIRPVNFIANARAWAGRNHLAVSAFKDGDDGILLRFFNLDGSPIVQHGSGG